MTRVRLRPTVADDLPHVVGEPLPYRIRAITAELEGEVLGIGGLGYRPDGTVIAFVQMKPEARKYPAAIHRAGLAALKMFRESGVPLVVAEAQEGLAPAGRWLERLGFAPIETEAGCAYVWTRPPAGEQQE